MADTPRRLVVSPTYNEREGLESFLARFPHADFDLLIVDDSSPDGTGELVRRLQETRPWLHLVVRPLKDGLAGAYRTGFAWALARDYAVIGQMDADLQHPPEVLEAMLAALADADLAIGSRYAAGGSTGDWSPLRRLLSRLGGLPTTLLLRLPLKDPTGGFKLWRRSALQAIDVASTISRGYVFQIETSHRAQRAGLRIVEVPFTFAARREGQSKMDWGVSREGVLVALKLALHPWRPARSRR